MSELFLACWARLPLSRLLASLCVLSSSLGAAPLWSAEILDCKIGFDGRYKLGLWSPARVTVSDAAGATIDLQAPDSDGIPTHFRAKAGPTNGEQTVSLYFRVGRRGGLVDLSVMGDEGDAASQPPARREGPLRQTGLPPTSRLLAEVAASGKGLLSEALPGKDRNATVSRLANLNELPDRWFGYESLDCILIDISNPSVAEGVTPESPSIRAMTQWVEAGGRVVIAGCGGAEQAIGVSGPLSGLVPGVYGGQTNLDSAAPLEGYADSDRPVSVRRRVAIPVAKLTETRGFIEAYAGRKPSDLPLVVRSRRGLGEVTFVGIDLGRAPIAEWEGLADLLGRACQLGAPDKVKSKDPSTALVTTGYDDLIGALKHRLGAQFSGVVTAPFIAVVAAAIAYLALIGPIDYFVLKRGIHRMQATWITFPGIVLLTGAGAYWLGDYLKGDQPRINQLELVDIDVESGSSRGALWAQAYSPEASRHEVSLSPRWPDGSLVEFPEAYVAEFGAPGRGLGGLDAPASAYAPLSVEYLQRGSADRITGFPINVRSTKGLVARWRGRAPDLLDADLVAPEVGAIVGSITNNTGADFLDAWLAHGDWAWRLGEVSDGAAVALDEESNPIKLKTLIQRDYIRHGADPAASGRSTLPVDVQDATTEGLLHLMMFHRALGGRAFSQLGNDFHSYTDLSALLDDGEALLVARLAGSHSELLSGEQSWAESTEADRVYYRFVLPLREGL